VDGTADARKKVDLETRSPYLLLATVEWIVGDADEACRGVRPGDLRTNGALPGSIVKPRGDEEAG